MRPPPDPGPTRSHGGRLVPHTRAVLLAADLAEHLLRRDAGRARELIEALR